MKKQRQPDAAGFISGTPAPVAAKPKPAKPAKAEKAPEPAPVAEPAAPEAAEPAAAPEF